MYHSFTTFRSTPIYVLDGMYSITLGGLPQTNMFDIRSKL